MRKLIVLLVGVGLGFVVAHLVSRTPGGARLFSQADEWVGAFGSEVAAAYRKRDAQLHSR